MDAIQKAQSILEQLISGEAAGHPTFLEDASDPNTLALEGAKQHWKACPGLWWDIRTAAYASAADIQNCLEIGTRTGWSLEQVFIQSPNVEAHVIEKWVPNYAGKQGNPESVTARIQTAVRAYYGEKHYEPNITFHNGDSHDLLPAIVENRLFDLILIDGDHTLRGAFADLYTCIAHVAPGGVLLFDDLEAEADPPDNRIYDSLLPISLQYAIHEQQSERLMALWLWMQSEHPEFIYLTPQVGKYQCGIAIKRDSVIQ